MSCSFPAFGVLAGPRLTPERAPRYSPTGSAHRGGSDHAAHPGRPRPIVPAASAAAAAQAQPRPRPARDASVRPVPACSAAPAVGRRREGFFAENGLGPLQLLSRLRAGPVAPGRSPAAPPSV